MADIDDMAYDWDEDDEDATADRYLLFQVAEEQYGIPISHVLEIVGVQKTTEVPEMPHYVKGVINLRGQVLPVADVRLRFGLDERDYDDRTCMIVVQLDEIRVSLVVDRVSEVITIPEADVSAPPAVQRSAAGRFIMGMARVGDEVKILLDVNKLLYDGDVQTLAAATA